MRQRRLSRERAGIPARAVIPKLQIGRRPRLSGVSLLENPDATGHGPEVLAGGLRLVTEGYIRSPPLPPTLLLDRRGDPVSTPAQIRPTDLYVSLRWIVRKMFKNIVFYSVSWLLRRSHDRVPVVSVMRAARTGLIDISWVSGTC